MNRRSDGTSERALLRALLEDAIFCLAGRAGPPAERGRLIADARRWVMSRDTCGFCSFENVCHVLDLEPAALRSRLLGGSNGHATEVCIAVRGLRVGRKRGSGPLRPRRVRSASPISGRGETVPAVAS